MELTFDILSSYVAPGLIVAAIVLYFIGIALKKTEKIDNKFIPLILGGCGIVLALIFGIASGDFAQNPAMGIYNAIVQGIVIAALPVYLNNNVKQLSSKG